MNIIYVVLMTMHVDYGNTYRLLPFFLMTYGLNVQSLVAIFSDDLWT